MNFFNTIFLKLVLLPSGLYKKMGVNVQQLKAILTAKLIMDDRRVSGFQQMRQKAQKKPVRFATISTMFISVLVGSFFLFSFQFGDNYITRFALYFSFYISFLASLLISDFTSVLIDIRDNYIILPKPVSGQTFVLSRLLHIFIHVCKIILPMMVPAIIYLAINLGAAAVAAYLPMIFMATLFTIFLINAIYILILKLTTPQKFQNIISYIQIAFAIAFYAAYQLMPRLMNQVRFAKFDISSSRPWAFIPSYWFAAGWQQLYHFTQSLPLIGFLALSFIVPVLSLWVVIKYFAPSFNQKLSLITGSTGESSNVDQKGTVKKTSASSYSGWLANIFTKRGPEHMGFLFTWKMMQRSRDFKMKVYPSIGYMVVIIGLMLFNMKTVSFSDIMQQTKQGKAAALLVIYFSNLMLISALAQITLSDKFKAAWIFFVTPVKTPGNIISGAIKACIAQFYFPIAALTIIVLTVLAGVRILPNVLFGIANCLLITAVSAYISAKKLPFSAPAAIRDTAGGFMRAISTLFIGSVVGVMHYLLYNITAVIIILTLLSGGAAWFVFDSISRYDWQKVNSTYNE